MNFIKELLDYNGNRYELARVVMEYSKKVKRLYAKDTEKENFKETLIALEHVLRKQVNYTLDKEEMELSEEALVVEDHLSEVKQKKKEKQDFSFKGLRDEEEAIGKQVAEREE